MILKDKRELVIKQRKEVAELFGFETRNKYEIYGPEGALLAYAAEGQKGFLGFLFRQFLGHFRRFEIIIYSEDRRPLMRAHHPFRFFFQELHLFHEEKPLGKLVQRFAFFRKRFDVLGPSDQLLMEMNSPFMKFWTFPFFKKEKEVAVIQKKWSGFLKEAFTDADSFQVAYKEETLSEEERKIILLAGIFIDLQYFEQKASGGH